jgi:hypothetical protein
MCTLGHSTVDAGQLYVRVRALLRMLLVTCLLASMVSQPAVAQRFGGHAGFSPHPGFFPRPGFFHHPGFFPHPFFGNRFFFSNRALVGPRFFFGSVGVPPVWVVPYPYPYYLPYAYAPNAYR